MKKIFILLVVLFVAKISAQNFRGSLYMKDRSTLYLNQMYVTNITAHKTYLSDYNGSFEIPAKVGDVIRFTSIVTERKDMVITKEILDNPINLIELQIAYKDISEIIISKFKPTGNLRKDVAALDSKKSSLEIAKKIGLPSPKGDGNSPVLPIASLANGGFSFSVDSIYDIISGERKKKQRLYEYEKMQKSIVMIKGYLGEEYFNKIKIPTNLVDNFLQFVYTSDDLQSLIDVSNLEGVKVYIEKYLPIYQKRLRASELQNVLYNK